jgi:hypothetical protein
MVALRLVFCCLIVVLHGFGDSIETGPGADSVCSQAGTTLLRWAVYWIVFGYIAERSLRRRFPVGIVPCRET